MNRPKMFKNNRHNKKKQLSVVSNIKKSPKYGINAPDELQTNNDIDNIDSTRIELNKTNMENYSNHNTINKQKQNKHINNHHNYDEQFKKQLRLLNCEIGDIQMENGILNTKITDMINSINNFHNKIDLENAKINALDNKINIFNEKIDKVKTDITNLNLYQSNGTIIMTIRSLNLIIPSSCYNFNNVTCIDNTMQLSNIKFTDTTGTITFDKTFNLANINIFGTIYFYCSDNGSIYNGIIRSTSSSILYIMSNRPLLPLGIQLNGTLLISLKIISK